MKANIQRTYNAVQKALAPFKFGVSRFGAMRIARKSVSKTSKRRPAVIKTVLIAGGSCLVAIGVAFLIKADLGLGAVDVAIQGISIQTGLSFGQSSWLFSACTLTLCLLVGAKPGLGTVGFLFSIGFFIDKTLQVVTTPDSISIRVAMFALSIVVIALGVAVVAAAGMGAGTFELLTDRAVKAGINRHVFRTGLEGTFLIVGILMGGKAGIGTGLIVVTIGPAIAGLSIAIGDLQRGRRERLTSN